MANIDASTNQTNLAWLAAEEKDILGLADKPAAYWTATERQDYLYALASDIVSQPNSFSDATIASAQQIVYSQDVQPDAAALQGYDLAWADFAPIVNAVDSTNVGQVLGAVGKGAQDLITAAGRVASNVASGATNLTATGSNASLLTIGLVAIVALLALNAASGVKKAVSF